MGGRRRRDDGWDEGRGDRQEGWRNPWQEDGRDGWPEPGQGDGRHRAALPAAGGPASGGDWPSASDRSAGGDRPPVTGYQSPAGQAGYRPAIGQGGYQSPTGQADYRGGAAAAGYGDAGYGAAPFGAAPFPGSGQGFADPGYQQPGYAEAGYAETGYPTTGGDPRYGDQGGAGSGYGYAGGGYADPGYGSAGWSGGYADPGYGQPAPGGSGFAHGAAHDASGNGRVPGSYPAGRTAGGRSDAQFPQSPATAQYGRSSSRGPDLANGEYRPSGQAGSANGTPPSTPRPYGRLSIFTLLEDRAAEFDRLAEQAAEGVRAAEPDTLVYVFHVVPNAPMQRIIYEIYRDREAFESHERQSHIQRFVADRKACVLATNIIDLRLKYAKVAALAATPPPAAPATAPAPSASAQETRINPVPGALQSGWPAESGDRYAGPGYERSAGSDDRVPRSRFVAWDQPAYQGQRPGGN
jgi:quinol monooxygenase YgiN